MPTFEYDLKFLQGAMSQLERYLLSSDLYWPVGVGAPSGTPPYPQLTLGAVLLAQARATAQALTPADQTALQGVTNRIDEIRGRWRVAWGQKAAADYHARLNLWRNFINEYRENPAAQYDRYAYEVGRRVQLTLLEKEASQLNSAEMEMLRAMDQLLRAVLQPGEFIWNANLQAGFPADVYWYLYGRLPKGDANA